MSKILIPKQFDLFLLQDAFSSFFNKTLCQSYFDNYNYQKSICIINQTSFLDFGFLILVQSKQWNSPIGVLYYDFYEDIENVKKNLNKYASIIQCVVSNNKKLGHVVPIGKSQNPQFHDYADGHDVIKFLT